MMTKFGYDETRTLFVILISKVTSGRRSWKRERGRTHLRGTL